MQNQKRDIPASACTLIVGEFSIGDNGSGAKSAPVRLVARSGKAIEHPFWGRIIHDLSGMRLHKPRLPIDYCHDSHEVIGYLNRFDTESGDLVTSGALTPFKDSDRATEIIHKSAQGVPYEASINFGGDGIKIEDIAEGMVAQVNGETFEGPGVIVREWPLRGVAICPYGADANTSSDLLSGNNAKTYAATVLSAEPEAEPEEDSEMSQSVETPAQVETPEAAFEDTSPQAELAGTEPQAVESQSAEAQPEPEGVEELAAVEEPQAEAQPEPEPQPLSRAEFTRIADRFGDAIAARVMREGGDFARAMDWHTEAVEKENAALRAQVAELSSKGGTPVPVNGAAPKPTLRELCERGTKRG